MISHIITQIYGLYAVHWIKSFDFPMIDIKPFFLLCRSIRQVLLFECYKNRKKIYVKFSFYSFKMIGTFIYKPFTVVLC